MNDPDAARAELLKIMAGIWTARAVHAAAELRLADHIAAGRSNLETLAEHTGTHSRSLYRLLRALVGCGVFLESDRGVFELTALSEALLEGAPEKSRAAILTLGGDWQWRAWERFSHSLRTGEPAMVAAFGKDVFSYLAGAADQGSLFNEAMIAIHGDDGPAAVAGYDFSSFRRIVDLGGGTGSFLTAVLRAHPNSQGLLFESAQTVAEAKKLFRERGLDTRCDTEVGDFFNRVPGGHDCYVLAHVLHDWTEKDALVILKNCRNAMARNAKLLIIEAIVPSGNAFHPAKMMDLLMLTVTGGMERTLAEFSSLLVDSGFGITNVFPLRNGQNIVEAVPA